MIVIAAVVVGFVAVIVAAIRLNVAIADSTERLRVLAGGYGDAGVLLEARQRFRRRQQSVEQAVDTGTVGIQAAHRTLSGLFGQDSVKGEGVYDTLRTFNRSMGRTLSGLFAPSPKKHSESLEEWRENNTSADRDERRD
ncbi:hypothetical protein SADO_05365 [Salinisphaera dokdonensis CL-ES53]|uniref:Uncharacterized protein n=1 Tax=Salinisphaera dokdonensis CL-ES53 TaxID=1304272 RepID=A0ABV2AZE9_9GAMM